MESEPLRTRNMSANPEKFLGLKRGSGCLKDNYLFKRILFEKEMKSRYEILANLFYHMMSFNWEEEKIAKTRTNISK